MFPLYAHHQGVEILLYNIWYHHTSKYPSRAQSSLNNCTGRPPKFVLITDAVQYNFDLLVMAT